MEMKIASLYVEGMAISRDSEGARRVTKIVDARVIKEEGFLW